MKLFACQVCDNLVYFESIQCVRCQHTLGYLPELNSMSALKPKGEEEWQALADHNRLYRYCANQTHGACNWLAPKECEESVCQACRLNRTIPNLIDEKNLVLFRRLQAAKHRLVYTLLRLRLPLENKLENPEAGLAFDFLEEVEGQTVLTGHADGVVTINIAEADDVERERRRVSMGERYRTLLGHLRHEVGHYYWDRLIRDSSWLKPVRELFGDERENYEQALETHYEQGPPSDWQSHFVSEYASSHPWEDWAETWAHYLHLVDTLETAYAFGLHLKPRADTDDSLSSTVGFDPYEERSFDRLFDTWLPVTFAVNSINRSMGHTDLYPFVLSEPATKKLELLHRIVHAQRT